MQHLVDRAVRVVTVRHPFNSCAKLLTGVEQAHAPRHARYPFDAESTRLRAVKEVKIALAVFLRFDTFVVHHGVLAIVSLVTFERSAHAVIPIANLAYTHRVFLRHNALFIRTDVQKIAAAHCHNAIDRRGQIAHGIEVLAHSVAPAVLADRVARLCHFFKSCALAFLLLTLGGREVTRIPSAVVYVYSGLQLAYKLVKGRIVNVRRYIPEKRVYRTVARKQLCDLIFYIRYVVFYAIFAIFDGFILVR